jgi:two-component system chemotaxis sensor kinase CheA
LPEGRCRLTIACRETTEAWRIEVADDGRGVDTDLLASTAVKKGLVSAEALATMTTDGRLRLIFEEGLSTKDAVTLDSGRGVGMGAILAAVQASHGEVRVLSTRGEGTQITLNLPKHPADALRKS